MPYRYLEDIATANADFEVKGRMPVEVQKAAIAIATFEVMADARD